MHSGASSRFLIGVAAVLATAGLLAGCSGPTTRADRVPTVADRRAPSSRPTRTWCWLSTATRGRTSTTAWSYNIEMVEVTGGEFWKPYDSGPGKVTRPPIDLTSERLHNLPAGSVGLHPGQRVVGQHHVLRSRGTSGGVKPGASAGC